MPVSLEPVAPAEEPHDETVEESSTVPRAEGPPEVEGAPPTMLSAEGAVEEPTAPVEQPREVEPQTPAPKRRGRPHKDPAAKAKVAVPKDAVRMKQYNHPLLRVTMTRL